MYYILCEDGSSGFYFWYLINRYMLNNKYNVETTHGISNMVTKLLNVSMDNNDKYFLCIDNSYDNIEVQENLAKIDSIILKNPHSIRKINYIAFEQALVSSDSFLKYFRLSSNRDVRLYNLLYMHSKLNYSDYEKLIELLDNDKIDFSTTERIFNKILERASTKEKFKETLTINGRKKKFDKYIMYHHYITKGAWSECWTTDCISGCPERFCWKSSAKLDNQYVDCINCNSSIKGNMSCLDGKLTPGKIRKFEEYVTCDRDNIPDKLEDRVRDLFENSILKDDIEFLKKW